MKSNKIAKIELTEKEETKLAKELETILQWASELDAKGDEEYFTDKVNCLREDVAKPCEDVEAIRKNFPKTKKGKVIVRRGL